MPEIKDSKGGLVRHLDAVVDGVIGLFSPVAAVRRAAARIALENMREYAAAKTTRMTGGWTPSTGNVNDILTTDLPSIRARVRQLVRDFPVFANAVSKVTDYCVGPGMTFQMKLRKKRGGELDTRKNSLIEQLWRQWSMNVTIDDRMGLNQLARFCKRTEVEDGEFLLIRRYPKGRGPIPYALQVVDVDWVTDGYITGQGLASDNVKMGVEYDKLTGRILAYHIRDPQDYTAKPVRVPAEMVVHGFDMLRPGQIRGVSPMVSGVILADAMNEFVGAEVDAARLMAKIFAFVETDSISEFQNARSYDTDADDSTKKIDDIEQGIVEYLKPGQKVNFNTSAKNSGSFDKFIEVTLRMISLCTGLSYEIVAGDYRGMNFTTIRGARNDMLKALRPMQDRFVAQFYLPIFKDFLDMSFLNGALPQAMYRDYLADPFGYLSAARFVPPGVAMIDPLRESRANIDQVDNLLMSPHEIAAERGRDPEEILDELAEWNRLKEERGLQTSAEEQSMTTNPAAVMKEENNDDEE